MFIFQEWKSDKEMIEDGVFAIVADLPTTPGASRTHGYRLFFIAPAEAAHIEHSSHLA